MAEDLKYIYMPFVAKGNDEDRMIEGPISSDLVDLDGQRVDPDWLKSAIPSWMSYGNIRYQHDPKRPIGVAQSVDMDHPIGPYLRAKIVDDGAWRDIKEGVLKGLSIGVKNAKLLMDGSAPKGRIVGGNLVEVSCVDHPSAHTSKFKLATKMVGADNEWLDHQSGAVITVDKPDIEKTVCFSEEDISKMAKSETEALTHECANCGDDKRSCDCPESVKGAFTEDTTAMPIHPTHAMPTYGGNPIPAQASLFDGIDQSGMANPITDNARMKDGETHSVAEQIRDMASKLDNFMAGHWNPNDTKGNHNQNKGSTEAPNSDGAAMGALPASMQVWHGENGKDIASLKAAMLSVDDVQKIAGDAVKAALDSIFTVDGLLTKGVEPDTTKAALVGLVETVAGDIAKAAVSELEGRLAQVEKAAAPPKGYTTAVDKKFVINRVDRQIVEADITKAISGLSDDDRTKLAAAMIASEYTR